MGLIACARSVQTILLLVAAAFWSPNASALMEDAPPIVPSPSGGGFTGSFEGPTSYSGGADIRLPDVTVTGKSSSEWRTVCVGTACATFIRSLNPMNNLNAIGNLPIDSKVKDIISKEVTVTACSILPGMPAGARDVTSQTEDVIRWRIGSQIIDAHTNNMRFVVTRKTEIKVTYSDSSTEIFIYTSLGSQHTPKPDSFKPGNGVAGSACQ